MKIRRPRRSRLWVEELEGRLVPSAVLSYSTNWSGYAVEASRHAVSYVAASWVVPTAASDTRYTASVEAPRAKRAQPSSAPWVVEAPSSSRVRPLAAFRAQTFTGAQATINGVSGGIDAGQAHTETDQVDMIGRHGTFKD